MSHIWYTLLFDGKCGFNSMMIGYTFVFGFSDILLSVRSFIKITHSIPPLRLLFHNLRKRKQIHIFTSYKKKIKVPLLNGLL